MKWRRYTAGQRHPHCSAPAAAIRFAWPRRQRPQPAHQYTPDIYIISTKVWDKLSKEQQDYLKECFVKLNENFVAKYNQMMDEAMEEAESYGVTVYRDIDKSAFIEAVQPMHEAYESKGEAYEVLYQDIQKYGKEDK